MLPQRQRTDSSSGALLVTTVTFIFFIFFYFFLVRIDPATCWSAAVGYNHYATLFYYNYYFYFFNASPKAKNRFVKWCTAGNHC